MDTTKTINRKRKDGVEMEFIGKQYSEWAVRFMIAEGICQYVKGIHYKESIYPKLTEIVDKVVKEWDDESK